MTTLLGVHGDGGRGGRHLGRCIRFSIFVNDCSYADNALNTNSQYYFIIESAINTLQYALLAFKQAIYVVKYEILFKIKSVHLNCF